jgi:hypothetical protein
VLPVESNHLPKSFSLRAHRFAFRHAVINGLHRLPRLPAAALYKQKEKRTFVYAGIKHYFSA